MPTLPDLEARREALLAEMRSLRSMRRGTLNEQFLGVPHKGQAEPTLRGPYYVFSRKENQRTVARRLTTPEEVATARTDIAAHQRFRALCDEFAQVTEQLGERLRQQAEDPATVQKKRRKSPSKPAPRSSGS